MSLLTFIFNPIVIIIILIFTIPQFITVVHDNEIGYNPTTNTEVSPGIYFNPPFIGFEVYPFSYTYHYNGPNVRSSDNIEQNLDFSSIIRVKPALQSVCIHKLHAPFSKVLDTELYYEFRDDFKKYPSYVNASNHELLESDFKHSVDFIYNKYHVIDEFYPMVYYHPADPSIYHNQTIIGWKEKGAPYS